MAKPFETGAAQLKSLLFSSGGGLLQVRQAEMKEPVVKGWKGACGYSWKLTAASALRASPDVTSRALRVPESTGHETWGMS